MHVKIIRAADLKEIDYGDTKVTNIMNDKDWPFNLAIVRKTGDDIKTGYDSQSDVAYYVLAGEGKSVIDGTEYVIKKGDCVVLPKGTKYKNLKGLTLLAIAYPPFDRTKRVYEE